MSHWEIALDPFLGHPTCYVPLAGHEEAVARLADLVESGQPLGVLSGESGLGKSTILDRLRRRSQVPGRRLALVPDPIDGEDLASSLATTLGMPGGWKALQAAIRVQTWQQFQLVVMVDECRDLLNGAGASDLKRLSGLGEAGGSRITLILATSDEPTVRDRPEFRDAPPARLKRLTRSDAATYLTEKLRAAGRRDEAFTPRALTRIHAASEGIPRTLDRLASLSLMAGAIHRLELISPDLVDEVSRELSPCYGGIGNVAAS
jgi:type II secretory pathway predicted ATPase ExeA